MENFTPYSAVIGGSLIGLAASLLMLLNGRIAGISGIFGGIFFGPSNDRLWRILFVSGLVLSPLLYVLATGTLPAYSQLAGLPLVIVAGFLVGAGTRLGSGCTSGHGICGVSRLSRRSIYATATFLLLGIVTATFLRPLLEAI